MKKKYMILLSALSLASSTFAQTWIWYPGDYEIWLGNQMNNRRTERGAFFPPFWKTDSHYVVVEFSKQLNLSEPEEIFIAAEGKYNVKLDGKLQFGMPETMLLPAGKHNLNIKVWNQATPPTIYVKGKTVNSDSSWRVTYEDKEWIDSNDYSERYQVATATEENKYFVKEGYQTAKLNLNREPRFYGTLGFDGSSWYGHGKNNPDDMYYLEAKKGQVSGQSSLALYSITGYYAKKLIYYKNIISETSEVIEEYPFPIVRLADLYLMYAEALNEATENGEFVPAAVYTNIDIVRKRSGLEGVVDSWKKYSTNPNKPSTKEGMREIIRKERQIELALEGVRYHDLRRWKLARSTYNNTFIRGWSIDQENTEDYYVIRNIAQKKYSQKDYLWPVKYDDIIRNPKLKQNPGW